MNDMETAELTSASFTAYASAIYDNPGRTSHDEFRADIDKFKYLNRLFKRYSENSDDLQLRLILNHLIRIGNVFPLREAVKMLLFKIDAGYYRFLLPFLTYLHYLPAEDYPVLLNSIVPDQVISEALRNL